MTPCEVEKLTDRGAELGSEKLWAVRDGEDQISRGAAHRIRIFISIIILSRVLKRKHTVQRECTGSPIPHRCNRWLRASYRWQCLARLCAVNRRRQNKPPHSVTSECSTCESGHVDDDAGVQGGNGIRCAIGEHQTALCVRVVDLHSLAAVVVVVPHVIRLRS